MALKAARKPALQDDSPKRQAILAAALELFAERGFHGTAVPLVAERAGVGAGTVYRYFDSKETLVNELFRHWKRELGRALLEGFPATATPRAQFHHFWVRLHDFAERHPRALQFLELHHHRKYLDFQSREVELSLLQPLRGFIAAGQRKKVLSSLPAEVQMAMIYGAFVGLVRAGWDDHITLFPELLASAEAALWQAIRR